MILYLSSATSYEIFNGFVEEKKIINGNQAQKFNSLLICGLCDHDSITCISNLPFEKSVKYNELSPHITGNIRYYILPNRRSKLLRKLSNYLYFKKLIKKAVKENKVDIVVCDAINVGASQAATWCSKKFNIPKVAIVTDVPEIMAKGRMSIWGKHCAKLMKNYDGYILLTKAMNNIVNPKEKPFIIMEGLCDPTISSDEILNTEKKSKVILYSGSLSKDVGIENLLEAFSKLNLSGWELHIYGNGSLVSLVEEKQQSYSSIKYKGIVPNHKVVQRQRDADVLINPRPEGIKYGNFSFPSKVMEYMVSATPVMSTRLPGIPDEYFNFVYAIEDSSVQGLEKAIKRVVSLSEIERIELGESARKFVVDHKSYKAQGARVAELLEQIKGKQR